MKIHTFTLLNLNKFPLSHTNTRDIKKYLIIVGGATASGKTALSIELAKHFDAPILSADSRQFYKEMRIGNARASEEELRQAKHYFVADRGVEDALSAGAFAKEASLFLEDHYKENDYAIVVGGSGLFLRAITEGLDIFPAVSLETRAKVDLLFDHEGIEGLQKALKKVDPDYFSTVDQNNPSRLRRALEVCFSGDHPFSYYRKQAPVTDLFVPIYLQPSWPREQLYERINKRVGGMLEEGLEEEARGLFEFRHLAALKTVGYQEWFAHFDGEYDRERAIELVKQNSRRYAKRQLTWFRRDGYWKHVFQGDLRSALAYIQLVVKENIQLLNEHKNASTEQTPTRFKVIHTRLGNKLTNEATGQTVLWKNKEDAWIKEWDLSKLTDVAKSILIHETLYRSECEKVYVFTKNDDLQVFGFQQVKFDDLSNWLTSKMDHKMLCWLWHRSSQEY